MAQEAGPSTSTCGVSPSVVPGVLRRHFAAYQRSALCLPSSATSSEHAQRSRNFIAPSFFEGWSGSSARTTKSNAAAQEAVGKQLEQTTQPNHAAAAEGSSEAWQDHPETKEERRQRERCEGWSEQLFKTSPMIRFMTRHLILVSCDPLAPPTSSKDFPRLTITSCPPTVAGGFSPSAPGEPVGQSGVLICSNRMMSKEHLEDTLAHEMIHWWDHCRFKVDWTDLRQHACSEIRASSLSGDCTFTRERLRRNWGLTKQHQTCTRRRAVLSVMANEKCKGGKEEAERIVDQVWNSCFSDTRPFDEIY